jgi:hypothetical protein
MSYSSRAPRPQRALAIDALNGAHISVTGLRPHSKAAMNEMNLLMTLFTSTQHLKPSYMYSKNKS